MIFPCVKPAIQKYKPTNTQMHKYTNRSYDEVPERPNKWYIFEKRIVQGYQKWYSHESNMHKYTNTSYGEVPKRHNMSYIFEKGIVEGYQK